MPMLTCPSCGRQISDQSRRCLYCAHLLVPLDAEAERRNERLRALYTSGMGMPRVRPPTFTERLRGGGVVAKTAALIILVTFLPFAPFRVFRRIRAIMQP
jgi:hypothetical protein